MDSRENARTTQHSRMLIIERLQAGWAVTAVAQVLGVTPKTGRKWRDRFEVEGAAGLVERSSRPHRSPNRLAEPAEAEIEALRRIRITGPAIARRTGRPLSTVGVVLRRRGLGRLRVLDPRPPILRYERERPGELLHIDIKRLGRIEGIGHRITGDRTSQSNQRAVGRGLGWEYLHVAIERVMTDNGSAYKSRMFAAALQSRGIAHKRTRPHTPRTTGKAERFNQSSIREWAYATPFTTSAERRAAMHPWLHDYNTVRPHAALAGKPPISRLVRDNVLGNDI